jgi:hypothetical protein
MDVTLPFKLLLRQTPCFWRVFKVPLLLRYQSTLLLCSASLLLSYPSLPPVCLPPPSLPSSRLPRQSPLPLSYRLARSAAPRGLVAHSPVSAKSNPTHSPADSPPSESPHSDSTPSPPTHSVPHPSCTPEKVSGKTYGVGYPSHLPPRLASRR